MITDINKQRVISYIDKVQPQLNWRELKQMREKYIFKDINPSEFKQDLKYLRQVNNIITKKTK